ncbi:MAG TPA: hypothetical protein PK668_11815 [Myxococcota bacterium]|nr:hypothetical protein [Myxococcota bacterium]HRY93845.1 hypothetical protein [Myxococcota bacterium]HSA23629.1 hypothetical protein [Myxococcota bacterium]
MLFTELVCQGVRNFGQTHRFPLGPGLTAFVAGAGGGKSTLVELVLHLLYPDPTEPSTEAFRAPGSDVCRAALCLQDEHGQTFRLVKDLLKGSMALMQLDPAGGPPRTVSAAAAEIGQYLSASLHLPQRDVFEGVFVTRQTSLPSRAPRRAPAAPEGEEEPSQPGGKGKFVGVRSGKVMTASRKLPPSKHAGDGDDGPSFPGYQGGGEEELGDAVLPDDPAELRSQIETLDRDLKLAREVDELQFKLDGLQGELFKLDQRLKGQHEAEQRVQQAEEAVAAFKNLETLPADFETRLKDYEAAKARLDRDSVRLDDEQHRWQEKSEAEAPPPLKQNKGFMLGLTGGVLATAVGAVGFFELEPLRWVALLNLLGFGLALVVALRHIDAIMSVERAQKRLATIDERRQKLLRQFEVETALVRKTMKDAGVEKPAQVLELFAKRKAAKADLEVARQAMAQRAAEAGLGEVQARRAELKGQVDELEARLASSASLMMSPGDMEARLEALRAKLARREAASGQEAGGAFGAPPVGGAGEAGDGLGGGFDPSELGAPPGALGGKGGKPAGKGRMLAPSALDAFGDPGGGQEAGAAEAPGAAGPEVCEQLVRLAEDLFLQDAERLAALLTPRGSQFAAALTGGAVSRLSLSPRREVGCLDPAGGERGLGELAPELQDRVYLALKAAVLEAWSRTAQVPILLDDPFRPGDPQLVELQCRLMAGLARLTQVILLTASVEQTQHATASFSL